MRHCRHSAHGKLGRFSAKIIYPIPAVICSLMAMYLLCMAIPINYNGKWILLIYVLISLAVAWMLVRMSVYCYRMESQKFSITDAGINLLSMRRTSSFTWDQIYEVAIVAYAASASRQIYQTVICCFIQPRSGVFLRKILCSYLYGAKHTDDFVIIDYDPAIIEEISARYPKEIADYRSEQLSHF